MPYSTFITYTKSVRCGLTINIFIRNFSFSSAFYIQCINLRIYSGHSVIFFVCYKLTIWSIQLVICYVCFLYFLLTTGSLELCQNVGISLSQTSYATKMFVIVLFNLSWSRSWDLGWNLYVNSIWTPFRSFLTDMIWIPCMLA